MSCGTFALVASLRVQAGSSPAQHGVPLALVNVWRGREGGVSVVPPRSAFTSGSASGTHAVLHHHEAALVALEAFALEAAGRVDAGSRAAQVRRDAALVDVWKRNHAERPTETARGVGGGGCGGLLPVQFLSSAVRAKPLLQRHLKLPMVLRQLPWVQRLWNTLHSFTSAGGSVLVSEPVLVWEGRLQLQPWRPTFVEGPPGQDLPPVGETVPSGADCSEFWGSHFRTLLAVHAPRRAHRAAAHVHAVSPRQRLATFVLVPLQEALLTAQV